MHTITVKITDDEKENTRIYAEAGSILRKGGLVAFPTETVYGLGGNGLDRAASRKIYAAKGRPSDNPLILHIADMDGLYGVAEDISDKALKLAEAFWPGPLTMVLKKADKVPYETTGGLDTVAVRMPKHSVASAMIKAAGVPVAAPSANISGRPSPTLAKHVKEDLDGRIDMIIDGGDIDIGIESTIVDMTSEPPVILRPGYVTKEMLKEVIGEITTDPALKSPPSENLKPKAPGMKYRHYAPKAGLTLYEGNEEAVASEIMERAKEKLRLLPGTRVAVIATEETKRLYDLQGNPCDQNGTFEIFIAGSRENPASIAKNLYAILRECDEKEVDFIFSETFSDDNMGQAVMNRLLKAAGYNIIKLCD